MLRQPDPDASCANPGWTSKDLEDLSGDPCSKSGFAEHEPGGRVKINVINRDPFSLDAIKTAVSPEATVTPGFRVFLDAGTTPIDAFSALFHCYITFTKDFSTAMGKDLTFCLAGLLYFGARTGTF